MRALNKLDIILHKVGYDTTAYKYWQLPTAEECCRKQEYLNEVTYDRNLCRYVDECGVLQDFTGEFDMYLELTGDPQEAYGLVWEEFINK